MSPIKALKCWLLSSLVASLIVVPVCVGIMAYAAPADDDTESIDRYAPTADFSRRPGYLLSFNGMTRTPRWTLECLVKPRLKKNADRAGMGFYTDPEIPEEFSPSPKSYEKSGYDLGHLAAAANHQMGERELKGTFTVANAMPQVPELNRGAWKALEDYLRGVAEEGNTVWIVTAPVYNFSSQYYGVGDKAKGSLGSAFHEVNTLPGRVWIPTHCAKSVLIERADGKKEMHSWILPNKGEIPESFDSCIVTTDEFENKVGIDVWAALPDKIEKELESNK